MIFVIKIDVDTERGTRVGVPSLLSLLRQMQLPASFFFSLGPDNTGRAIKRVLRRGFLKKVSRTNVIGTYGIRTLLNGLLLPGPHIGKRHEAILRAVHAAGFEVGIHAYDHQKWQDGVNDMLQEEIAKEFDRARIEFRRIFGVDAQTAGAPGWQANAKTLAVYDAAGIAYASDCRGVYPFFPYVDGRVFSALQIPTTLPTLDELVGLQEFVHMKSISEHYFSLLHEEQPNVMTIHAELEGMKYLAWFREFLLELQRRYRNVRFQTLHAVAQQYLTQKDEILVPICNLEQSVVVGRSGMLAQQGAIHNN